MKKMLTVIISVIVLIVMSVIVLKIMKKDVPGTIDVPDTIDVQSTIDVQGTIEGCPNIEALEAKIDKAKKGIEKRKKGHVFVGRVILDGDGDVRHVTSQMEILPEGYFAGPLKDLVRPVGFRMHQYAPYDLQLSKESMTYDQERDLYDIGTFHLKPLAESELLDFKAQIVLENGGDPSQAILQLGLKNGPINTPSNGIEPRRHWADFIEIAVQDSGLAEASGFSPIQYWCQVKSPDYLRKRLQLVFKEGQTLDLGTITLEKPKQIELAYIVAKELPFNPDDLKTVKISAGTKWKAKDDIYGWDLEFRQDKGSIVMKYSYAPCYLWDMGDGEIAQYVNIDEEKLGQRLKRNPHVTSGNVYLVDQRHWKRWVLVKIVVE